jgi:hypothetical protein
MKLLAHVKTYEQKLLRSNPLGSRRSVRVVLASTNQPRELLLHIRSERVRSLCFARIGEPRMPRWRTAQLAALVTSV